MRRVCGGFMMGAGPLLKRGHSAAQFHPDRNENNPIRAEYDMHA
jgi:hypothetical protein